MIRFFLFVCMRLVYLWDPLLMKVVVGDVVPGIWYHFPSPKYTENKTIK